MSQDFEAAVRLIHQEAWFVDQRDWPAWLALYTEDCTFWVPTWRDERQLVSDPQTEISFLYLHTRAALAERVKRLGSGKSITTTPPVRTAHVLSGSVELPASETGAMRLGCAWTNHIHDPRTHQSRQLFGHYEYELAREHDGVLRIASKKITVANDRVATVLDIYSV